MSKLAATLFATPPSSTYQEALDRFSYGNFSFFLSFFLFSKTNHNHYFLFSAENLEPNFYKKNTVMIGKTLMKMKNTSEAKQWLTKALSLPINNPDDEAAHKEAQDLLKSL